MILFETILLWIGTYFTTEVYMTATKAQGILWSLADIILVFAMLKIADHVRSRLHKKNIRFRYLFLWLSAFLTPLLLFTQTPRQFFILESIICGGQFFILVYTVIAERKDIIGFIMNEYIPGSQKPAD